MNCWMRIIIVSSCTTKSTKINIFMFFKLRSFRECFCTLSAWEVLLVFEKHLMFSEVTSLYKGPRAKFTAEWSHNIVNLFVPRWSATVSERFFTNITWKWLVFWMDDHMILEMLRSSKPSCSEWQPNIWVFRFELLEYTLKHVGHVCSLTNIFSPAKFETPRVNILIGEQRLLWMKFLWHVFTFERFHFSIVQFFPPKLQIL